MQVGLEVIHDGRLAVAALASNSSTLPARWKQRMVFLAGPSSRMIALIPLPGRAAPATCSRLARAEASVLAEQATALGRQAMCPGNALDDAMGSSLQL